MYHLHQLQPHDVRTRAHEHRTAGGAREPLFRRPCARPARNGRRPPASPGSPATSCPKASAAKPKSPVTIITGRSSGTNATSSRPLMPGRSGPAAAGPSTVGQALPGRVTGRGYLRPLAHRAPPLSGSSPPAGPPSGRIIIGHQHAHGDQSTPDATYPRRTDAHDDTSSDRPSDLAP